MEFLDGITTGKFRDLIEHLIGHWWDCSKDAADERKATSLELSGVLPDGTKFAIKEYAKDSAEAYRIAYETVSKARGDFQK